MKKKIRVVTSYVILIYAMRGTTTTQELFSKEPEKSETVYKINGWINLFELFVTI